MTMAHKKVRVFNVWNLSFSQVTFDSVSSQELDLGIRVIWPEQFAYSYTHLQIKM